MQTVSDLRNLLLACALALGCAAQAQAQGAGEVEFSRGVGFAQSPGQMPRTLGKGLPLREGDRLTTSDGGSAIIKLQDGTRMTVRPNSELFIQQYQFKENAPDNSMVMQLLRGGFRAITGLISKNAPGAAQVRTSTATIGIRGTDFDARLCNAECRSESSRIKETPKQNTVAASAKLVSSRGEIYATDGAAVKRRVVDGGALYPGETIETAAGAQGVLVFRDDSRLTLGSNTRFRVDNFVFDAKNPGEGRFLVSLLRGSLRALTGLIGKANTRNVGLSTVTATIGIRGTGLDIECKEGEGADTIEGSCTFFTWLGAIEVTPKGQTALQVLQAGQGLYVGPQGVKALNSSPLESLPRPDGARVDLKQLFGTADVPSEDEGLFVFVRDGHIEVTTARETLHLGRGETGFAAASGTTARPPLMPLFIEFDRQPMPNAKHPLLSSVLGDSGVKPLAQCR